MLRRLHTLLMVCSVACFVLTWSSSRARACEIPAPERLQVDGDPADQNAPSAPEVRIVTIDRGERTRPEGCSQAVVSSCDDIASLEQRH